VATTTKRSFQAFETVAAVRTERSEYAFGRHSQT
jgi:hypothetical protein